MARFPDAAVYAALQSAARKHGIPVTLLMGVAFVESSFDPKRDGPLTSRGRAQGLMQLMPSVQKAYGVTDPYNAVQSADGGAALLAALRQVAVKQKWPPERVLYAYNWGIANLSQALNEGKPIPQSVLDYARKVQAARYFYEGSGHSQADVDAPEQEATLTRALDRALRALVRLNPSNNGPLAMLVRWEPYYQKHKDDLDVVALANVVELRKHWEGYRAAFEGAAITSAETPAPYKLEPDVWKATNQLIDAATKKAKDVTDTASKVVDAISDGTQRLWDALPLAAAFALLVVFTRRRR